MSFLLTALFVFAGIGNPLPAPGGGADSSTARLIAFGDVNLGRWMGKQILRGDTSYPFTHMATLLREADIVFVNLESPISEQHGITESRISNVVFCAPPAAACTLERAHITVVSTANNHAFDFGLKGVIETLTYLHAQGIGTTGTCDQPAGNSHTLVITAHAIRVGFAAFTQFVNIHGPWDGYISVYDREGAMAEISRLRAESDIVIASFHGGKEFGDAPDEETQDAMHSLIDAGADLVIGHHPHVPQGIERYKKKLIFYSLGNFVFIQPQNYWAQVSYGVDLSIRKNSVGTTIESVHLLPIRASSQPHLLDSRADVAKLIERTRKSSTATIVQENQMYVVQRD